MDEADNEIGTATVLEAHKGKGKLHRAASVFLFRKSRASNKNGSDGPNQNIELLIQKRSHKKIVSAGLWANTCCGNVRPGESYKECALRRLREELGIEVKAKDLKQVHKFIYQVACDDRFSEHEVDTVFFGEYDGDVEPNPDEVAGYQWIGFEELIKDLDEEDANSDKYSPWLIVMHRKGILRELENCMTKQLI